MDYGDQLSDDHSGGSGKSLIIRFVDLDLNRGIRSCEFYGQFQHSHVGEARRALADAFQF